ncbi:MAG: orotate phosphoribosyltransferase [Candidatus Binatia bacterium]
MTASTPDHELVSLLARLCYRSGEFTLASGKKSDFYIDVKQAVFSAEGFAIVARNLLDELASEGITLVGGMALGAIPLVSAALSEAARRDYALDGFFVRKTAKDHGTARRLDGRFDPDATIALVEDVVTTGESTLDAVDAVEAAGGRVSLIIAVVDREENDGLRRLAERCGKTVALASKSSVVAAAALP